MNHNNSPKYSLSALHFQASCLAAGIVLFTTTAPSSHSEPAKTAQADPAFVTTSNGTIILKNADSIIRTTQSRSNAEPQATQPATPSLPKDFGAISENNLQANAQFELGDIFYNQKKVEAIAHYEQAVSLGHAFAAYRLGDIYQWSRISGVDQDMLKAVSYYEKAAKKNDAAALDSLARIYAEGAEGVPVNPEKAAQYFRLCAEEGIGCGGTKGAASLALGKMYAEGRGVPRNTTKAIAYMEKGWGKGLDLGKLYLSQADSAAPEEKGNLYTKAAKNFQEEIDSQHTNPASKAEAQYLLSQLYAKGLGVLADAVKAMGLIAESAEGGFILAQFSAGGINAESLRINSNPDAILVIEASSNAGTPRAQYEMGTLLLEGIGMDKDAQKAGKLFHAASKQGEANASFALAKLHLQGEGVRKDGYRAFVLMQEAAEAGNPDAQLALAEMYANGKYVRPNAAEAFAWYLKASTSNFPEAQFAVGSAYAKSRGTEFSPTQAIEYLKKAADQNHTQAQLDILNLRFSQTPFHKDLISLREALALVSPDDIFRYAEGAAAQGNLRAKYFLGKCYAQGIGVAKDDGKAAKAFSEAAGLSAAGKPSSASNDGSF